MVKWLRTKFTKPIGVDLTGRRIQAVQMGKSSHGLSVIAAASMDRMDPASQITSDEIRKFLESLPDKGFVGNEVVLAVPGGMMMTDIIDLPPRSSGAPVEQIALAEVSRMHKRDPNTLEMACWDLPAPARAGGTLPVMAVACQYSDAYELIKLFVDCGYSVLALDTRSWALARAYESLRTIESAITAIIEISWDQAHLVVMHGRLVAYERSLKDGGIGHLIDTLTANAQLTSDDARRLLDEISLDPKDVIAGAVSHGDDDPRSKVATHFDTMAGEIQTPLAYLEDQYPQASVQKLLLVGAGSLIRGIDAYLASWLEVEVQVISPSDVVEVPDELSVECGAESMAAMGLSLYTNNKTSGVNLIPAPRVRTARRRVRTHRWAAVCTTYILMLAVIYLACRFRWTGQCDPAAREEMAQIVADIEQYNRRIASTRMISSAIEAKSEANQAVKNQPDWSVLLAMLSKNLGPDVVLKNCKLNMAEGVSVISISDEVPVTSSRTKDRRQFMLELSGLGRTQTAVSQFVLRLEKSGLFDKVKLVRTTRESFYSGKAVSFDLVCSLGAESRS